jgi:hypothetical protein
MSKTAVLSLVVLASIATAAFPNPSGADPVVRHRHVIRHHAVYGPGPAPYYGAPGYYGVPGNYYPAPPFPFFLIPGPWWLPAHP